MVGSIPKESELPKTAPPGTVITYKKELYKTKIDGHMVSIYCGYNKRY